MYRIFDRLANVSNGQVYDLDTKDISSILDDVTQKLDKRHVLLSSIYRSDAGSEDFLIPIDKTVNQFHIMISGQNPAIKIHNPNNILIENSKQTVNLRNVKGYTIDDIIAGTWKIEASSDSSYSIQVTGNSDLLFTHGFSIQPTESIEETTFSPLSGKCKHL